MADDTIEKEIGTTSIANDGSNSDVFVWNTKTIVQSIVLFGLAGVAEVVGGWLVWMAMRGSVRDTGSTHQRWIYALGGSALLVIYGFIPCLQPTDSFGRIYAAYGGFFILLSFLFGWALDGDKPDLGDVTGGLIALGGVLVILFWPR